MTVDPIIAQKLILKFFGFSSPVSTDSTNKSSVRLGQLLVRRIQVLLSWGIHINNFRHANQGIQFRHCFAFLQDHDQSYHNDNPSNQSIPRCFYGIRALFILLYFVSKKSAFQQLQLNMDSLQQWNHQFSFEEQNLTRKTTKLPWLSKILLLATTAVHVTFVMVDWRSMLVNSSARSAEYCHFENACVSSLFALVLWSVTLDLSFILSQQVTVCAIILTVVSTNMLSVLVNDIQQGIGNYLFKSEPSKKQVTALRRKILRWAVAYIAIKKFTDEINFSGRFYWLLSASTCCQPWAIVRIWWGWMGFFLLPTGLFM